MHKFIGASELDAVNNKVINDVNSRNACDVYFWCRRVACEIRTKNTFESHAGAYYAYLYPKYICLFIIYHPK